MRVFAYRAPTDMRKSFNTLAALVLEMGQDVVAGDAFLPNQATSVTSAKRAAERAGVTNMGFNLAVRSAYFGPT